MRHFILLISIVLSMFVFGCGASFSESRVDTDGEVQQVSESDMGPWGVDTIEPTEFRQCLMEIGKLPNNEQVALCRDRIRAQEGRATWGGGYYPGYGYGGYGSYYNPYYRTYRPPTPQPASQPYQPPFQGQP